MSLKGVETYFTQSRKSYYKPEKPAVWQPGEIWLIPPPLPLPVEDEAYSYLARVAAGRMSYVAQRRLLMWLQSTVEESPDNPACRPRPKKRLTRRRKKS